MAEEEEEQLTTYRCVAEIDEDATSPEEAARMANDDFRDTEMTGLVFTVYGAGMQTPLQIDSSGMSPTKPVESLLGPAVASPFEIVVPVPVGDHDIVLKFPNERELRVQLRPSNADIGYNGSLDIILDRDELVCCWAGDDMQPSKAPDETRQHERRSKQLVMTLPYDPSNPQVRESRLVDNVHEKLSDALADYFVSGRAAELIQALAEELAQHSQNSL